jgi:hypothetical protein
MAKWFDYEHEHEQEYELPQRAPDVMVLFR